jgi:hypothetical protein
LRHLNKRVAAKVASHWRGDLPVAVSVVIVAIGLTLVYNLFSTLILNQPALQERYLLQLSLLAIVMVLSLPISIWQIIGAWRSIVRSSSKPGYGGKVIGAVGLAMLSAFVFWNAKQLLPRFTDLYRAVISVAIASSKYEIRRSPESGQHFTFVGEIAWGASADFEKFVESRPELTTLELDSMGGSLQEATRMARLIRVKKLATFVGRECLSACTLVFSAGHPRIASRTAKFGFHRPVGSSLVSDEFEGRLAQDYAKELLSNGIDKPFVDEAIRVHPPYIWIPNTHDLEMSKFVEQFRE